MHILSRLYVNLAIWITSLDLENAARWNYNPEFWKVGLKCKTLINIDFYSKFDGSMFQPSWDWEECKNTWLEHCAGSVVTGDGMSGTSFRV